MIQSFSLQSSVATILLCCVFNLNAAEAQTGLIPEMSRPAGTIEILDKAALALIDRSQQILVRAEGYSWAEGPLWIADGGYLLFSDVPNNIIHRYEPGAGTRSYLEKSGATGRYPDSSSEGSNGLLLDASGRLVILQHGDRRVALMDAALSAPSPEYVTLAEDFDGKRLNSPNDGVYNSKGHLYFTDPPYGLPGGMTSESKELAFQGIYLLRPDDSLQLLDDSVTYPNGIALSPDESTLYLAVSDKSKAQWLTYDVMPDGSLSNQRVFHDASSLVGQEGEPGLPDGLAVHSSGVLFATGPGGVWVFNPDGRVLAKIRTGKATANCALSADEKVLFMTAHDTLMTLRLN
ncbi:MAG: SMP-30/gluconolactonase/LRE family protein [Xanthomonadales bacterium]|jgi:gluconolactonase|nr:SMP-30/gluconolactonase/LRE family protein [Xanthomonadales bacterium]MDH4002691.1 SMP-30/gluconolactonase/LRE family protein [Xanthomonadales bacterium]